MKIQHVWVNKNISPEPLANEVESFFKAKGFLTKRRKINERYVIIAKGRHEDGSYVRIDAKIFRKNDELFIELSAGEQSIISKLGSLTNLLMGGYVTLQRLKSEETLAKLESEFHKHINRLF